MTKIEDIEISAVQGRQNPSWKSRNLNTGFDLQFGLVWNYGILTELKMLLKK